MYDETMDQEQVIVQKNSSISRAQRYAQRNGSNPVSPAKDESKNSSNSRSF